MKRFYLRAGSFEELRDGLIMAGVLQELGGGHVMPTGHVWIMMLGTIFSKPAKNDEGEVIEPVALAGYHANLTVFDGFKGDVSVLEPFVIEAPTDPYMPHG
jgi:hypothetical protein